MRQNLELATYLFYVPLFNAADDLQELRDCSYRELDEHCLDFVNWYDDITGSENTNYRVLPNNWVEFSNHPIVEPYGCVSLDRLLYALWETLETGNNAAFEEEVNKFRYS